MANWNKKDSQTDKGSTSGNREESMQGSQGTRGKGFDTSGTTRGNPSPETDRSYGSENLKKGDEKTGRSDASSQSGREKSGSDQSGSMQGSSSGTTGLGSERNRSGGSGGGVEGVRDESSAIPDEDRSRR